MSRLPATGDTITMGQVANIISFSFTELPLSDLGNQISIATGNTVLLSENFGYRDENDIF